MSVTLARSFSYLGAFCKRAAAVPAVVKPPLVPGYASSSGLTGTMVSCNPSSPPSQPYSGTALQRTTDDDRAERVLHFRIECLGASLTDVADRELRAPREPRHEASDAERISNALAVAIFASKVNLLCSCVYATPEELATSTAKGSVEKCEGSGEERQA